MGRRRSYGAGERIYRFNTAQLQARAARAAAIERYGAALGELVREAAAMHAHFYPECREGCPTLAAIAKARKLLET